MRKTYIDNIRWMTVVAVVIYHVLYMFNGVVTSGVIGPFAPVQYQDAFLYFIYPWFMLLLFVISGIWQEVGFGSIIYLAALTGISQELYEAARIDGANKWQQTLNVTIPGIVPTIMTMLIMRMGNVMSVGYEKIMLLYNSQIYETSDVISTYVYRIGILQADFGYSTAIGLFNSVINLIILVIANKISYKATETGLW